MNGVVVVWWFGFVLSSCLALQLTIVIKFNVHHMGSSLTGKKSFFSKEGIYIVELLIPLIITNELTKHFVIIIIIARGYPTSTYNNTKVRVN